MPPSLAETAPPRKPAHLLRLYEFLLRAVFSLVFVMAQFSAVAHSPRLVLWIARDRVIWHSLGVFTATFIYSMAAIAWLDRDRSGRVLFFSGWLVVGLLLASVGMFIALVDRVAVLQAKSVQVMRRMKALASDLIAALPKERHAPLLHYQERLDATIARSFEDAEEKREASIEDRQGLGLSRRGQAPSES
jgi:uncharacterized membrane protein